MSYNKINPLFIIALLAVFACSEDDNQDPANILVGVWEGHVPSSGYSATWQFNNDRSYHLDFASPGIAGAIKGFSSGTYDLISDSILVVHSIDSKILAFNYAFRQERDTLLVQIEDFTLTSMDVRLVLPSQDEIAGTTIVWIKRIE